MATAPEPDRYAYARSPAELEAERIRQQKIEADRQKHERQAAIKRQLEEARQRQEQADQVRKKEEEARRERVWGFERELVARLDDTLTGMGYRPPAPPPIIADRALRSLTAELGTAPTADPEQVEALRMLANRNNLQLRPAKHFLGQIQKQLDPPGVLGRVRRLLAGARQCVDRAVVSLDLPDVSPRVLAQIHTNERFLASEWAHGERAARRGVLAVHVDPEKGVTIVQIGIAEHGPIYITLSGLLDPERVAQATIRLLLDRVPEFRDAIDPVAVIDGSHQGLNYNTVFPTARVYRAPSGDTERLLQNITKTAARERLAPENTVILNSAPRSRDECTWVFGSAARWPRWDRVAGQWDGAAAAARFGVAPEPSREAVLQALATAQNVIVIVAHCDGQEIRLPAPPPRGTQVTAEYLRENRAAIAANAPFVYLFACKAAQLQPGGLRDFASVLLECGAAGVVASQVEVDPADSRPMFERVLDDRRGQPPIEDFYRAMGETGYREMEVFLG